MSNIREFFHTTIAGDTSTGGGEGFPLCFKCQIICAYDCVKEYEWGEIDGVRRITEVRFYSEATNLANNSNFYVKRVFSYLPTSPRDLYEIKDVLLPL